MLGAIISRVLSSSGCNKMLAGDGITVPELSIKDLPGLIEAISVDMRSARKSLPAIGQTASIAKNLDEYQFRICSLVPSLPDSDPRKMQLQKYRVVTVAALAALASLLKKPDQTSLEKWCANAKPLLEEMSDVYLKSSSKLQSSHKGMFEFFKVPENQVDAALAAFYGQ